jgi:hypothetical protein
MPRATAPRPGATFRASSMLPSMKTPHLRAHTEDGPPRSRTVGPWVPNLANCRVARGFGLRVWTRMPRGWGPLPETTSPAAAFLAALRRISPLGCGRRLRWVTWAWRS